MTTLSPNDSAISITQRSSSSGSRPQVNSQQACPTDTMGTQSGSSPVQREPSPILYQDLSPAERAAADAEFLAAMHQAQNSIEVSEYDPEGSDDPGYETDSDRSATTSISSSVRNYMFENGRRYHAFREGVYNFPNDDSEQAREELKHNMMMNMLGTLHFAPIGPAPRNVLDLGTGIGLWAIEMADKYPLAKVMGIDLSPIQPMYIPPNCQFVVDDMESEWLQQPNLYDLVHTRHTVMAVRDWPRLMRQALEHLKPGGWLELQEIVHRPQTEDGSMPPNHPIANYWNLIHEALSVKGIKFDIAPYLEQMMRQAGFVDVTVRVFYIPLGDWPKNMVLRLVGTYWQAVLEEGLEAIALGPLTRMLGWTRDQVIVNNVTVRNSWRTLRKDGVHSFMPCYIVTGQKPLQAV